ncbi:hypothetical protein [Streptomyces litmocidini]|uniref:Uncharacterized protein n=1 Tax=Streptomyces litmocidini TaxID=67318 RepID=A0ABW7UD95_9ACTN
MATVRSVSRDAQPLGALTADPLATYAGTHAALRTVCAAALLPPPCLLMVPAGRRRVLT